MGIWITIQTFELPHELFVLRGRLESEGIQCNVPNEHTHQMQPYFASALGEVRLQVLEKDLERAIEILLEGGYKIEQELEDNKFVKAINNWNAKEISIVERKFSLKQVIITISIVILIVISSFYIMTRPSDYQKLIANQWCVKEVLFKNEKLFPFTKTSDYIQIKGGATCDEFISFFEHGGMLLPGFKTRALKANWNLIEDSIIISGLDTLTETFGGTYHYKFNWDKLTLMSKSTIIICSFKDEGTGNLRLLPGDSILSKKVYKK